MGGKGICGLEPRPSLGRGEEYATGHGILYSSNYYTGFHGQVVAVV